MGALPERDQAYLYPHLPLQQSIISWDEEISEGDIWWALLLSLNDLASVSP